MADAKSILSQVKKLEISTRTLVDGLMAGNYHSVFKGSGIEFSDIREYVPGDDIRTIDWKVTARIDTPFVKEFIEERDVQVYVVLDVSGSATFGNASSKLEQAMFVAASLMYSAMRSNDSVGLVLATDTLERFVRARKGQGHWHKMLGIMVSHSPKSRETDLGNALGKLAGVVKKRSIIFVISDFYRAKGRDALRLLRRRHDLIAVQVEDESELELPDIGFVEFEDPESGEQFLADTSSERFRVEYARLVLSEQRAFEQQLRQLKIDLVRLSTARPYAESLSSFFRRRLRRRR